MKILRIAGKNLASLGGEFALDFMQEPLVSAGLFAICGPTGAGKSTLLDTLCLALYDATPRLSRAGSKGIGLPDVRDETVTPQDTRNLLRRGAADGYAEVDFIGNDAKCYRARWSVRRARAKADGALQQVAMSLHSLPELHPIGGTNREVKAEIEQRIGLNFDQFTRAVLLAQNEFSAFLRADDGDRGELLETLTGTAIYSDMSRRAFERSKLEQQALNAINQRLADQKPLDAEARLELERDCAQAHDAMTMLEHRKGELETQMRWHNALQEAQRSEELARLEAGRLFSIYQGMAERQKHMALLDAVQSARALVEESSRIASTLETNKSELDHLLRQLDTARQDQEHVRLAMSTAEQSHLAALQTRKDALPAIDKAKTLDAQIAALAPENDLAKAAVARIQAERNEIETRLAAGRKTFEAAVESKRAAEQWMADQAFIEPLASQWMRWDSLLKHADTQLQNRTGLAKELAEGREALRRVEDKMGELEGLLANAVRTHADAEAQKLTCQFESASHSRATLRLERQHLESHRDVLEDGARLWSELQSAAELQRELKSEFDRLRSSETEAAEMQRRFETDIAVAKAALDQAEKAQFAARIACSDSVENLRASLESDAPCPVCGSTEHPYADDTGRLHSMLAGFDAEAAACRTRYDQSVAREAGNSALILENRRRLTTVSEQLHDAVLGLQAAEAEWVRHPSAQLAELSGSGNAGLWIADEIHTARNRLQQLALAETEADQAASRLELAQHAYDAATSSLGERRRQSDSLANEERQVRSEVERLTARLAETDARLNEILDELSAAFGFPHWREDWRRNPAIFRSECVRQVTDWQDHCRIRDENSKLLIEFEADSVKLQEGLLRSDVELERSTKALEENSCRINEKRALRAGIFGGKDVAVVEDELGAAIASAMATVQEQSMKVQDCAISVARHQENIEQVRQRMKILEAEHVDTLGRLADWIEHFNTSNSNTFALLERERLQELLAYSLEWMSAERNELHAAFTAMQTANAIFQERTQRRTALEHERVGSEDPAGVVRHLDDVLARFEVMRTDFTRNKLALAEDDSRRERSSVLLAELERQQSNARLWGQLAELIGSADGKKFRNYAQQFTLDVLLGYANRHLQELVRRYRLERVKETLALLVVDQDMGDEVRSIHSLSGGESFLVSLALALGLASLSSNRVRVESLFIDEGFGSLDADTLSIAMHALDSLQSQGRKVGVITHVQEMSERIGTKVLVQRVAGGKSLVRIESESVF